MPDPECALHHVRARRGATDPRGLSSSFGFGGMDTVLVFGRADAARSRGAAAIALGRRHRRRGAHAGRDLRRARRRRACRSATAKARPSRTTSPQSSTSIARAASIAPRASRRSRAGVRSAHDARTRASSSATRSAPSTERRRSCGGSARRARASRAPRTSPGLVPSSPAGHVSIYLGLAGPTLVVADLATSGECAVTQGYELVAAGETDRVAVVAVEEKSTIVDQVFRVVFGPDKRDASLGERPLRREGAGADRARRRRGRDRARAADLRARRAGAVVVERRRRPSPRSLPPPGGAKAGAVVIIGVAGDANDALLASRGLGRLPPHHVRRARGLARSRGRDRGRRRRGVRSRATPRSRPCCASESRAARVTRSRSADIERGRPEPESADGHVACARVALAALATPLLGCGTPTSASARSPYEILQKEGPERGRRQPPRRHAVRVVDRARSSRPDCAVVGPTGRTSSACVSPSAIRAPVASTRLVARSR